MFRRFLAVSIFIIVFGLLTALPVFAKSEQVIAPADASVSAESAILQEKELPKESLDSPSDDPEVTAISFTNIYILRNQVIIQYPETLMTDPAPLPEDYSLTSNGEPIAITDAAISGKEVILTTAQALTMQDVALVSYQPTGTPLRTILDNEISTFTDYQAYAGIPVGAAPVYSTPVGNKLYVSNKHSGTVTVINTLTDRVLTTIPVGYEPEVPVLVGTKLYISNRGGSSVSVIDTINDTVIATLPVGLGPYFATVAGTKVYIANQSDTTVSVIDTNTDTVTATIPVGTAPYFPVTVGTRVYVPNRLSHSVSVIDTATDTVIATIQVGLQPYFGATNGTRLFISNGEGRSISVIDTTSNTVIATIPLGQEDPYFSTIVGNNVYVPNRLNTSVSVINITTNQIITTIPLSHMPYQAIAFNNYVFVSGNDQQVKTVSVIDTTTNTVVDLIPVWKSPFYMSVANNKLYVANNQPNDPEIHDGPSSLSVIDIPSLPSQKPQLLSFTSSTPDGIYHTGDVIAISAVFDSPLSIGSTMTVRFNSGGQTILNQVNGNTLSGSYVIGANQYIPDLSISSIVSASVSDEHNHTRTNYLLPSSPGNFVGENSFITRNLGDIKNISIDSFVEIPVGLNPYQVSAPVTKNGVQYMYVANQGAHSVSVIRLSDKTLVNTIQTGDEPYGLTLVTLNGITYVYVANTLSNTVTVINTASDTVTATIPVGIKPYYVEHIGTMVYVTNGQSNTVSVINAATNTVTETIPVGIYPRGIKALGNNLYVANYGDPNYGGGNSVSVIDAQTNTVTNTILLPLGVHGPRGVTVAGTTVYVTAYRTNQIIVINSATNAVTALIPVGRGPRGVAVVGQMLYVENFDEGTISIIDRQTNTVIKTIFVGHSPAGMGVAGTDIYISRFQDNMLSILDTTTNTLRSNFDVTAPDIQGLEIAIKRQEAIFTWQTDEPADSLLEYGPTEAFGKMASRSALTTDHSLTTVTLKPRKYFYRISSADAAGNRRYSEVSTFSIREGKIFGELGDGF